MTRRPQFIIQLFLGFVIVQSIVADKCNRYCGKHYRYPFGFSAGCPIRLNCSANGTALIHDFPVEKVTHESVLVSLPAVCGRPIRTLGHFFGQNYRPSSRNGILLQNCSSEVTGCMIPLTMVQANFELLDCGPNKSANVSCYAEKNSSKDFIDFEELKTTGCGSLFSAISSEATGNSSSVLLDVQVVKLGWWMEGNCRCAKHANCTHLLSPVTGRQGHRCQCVDGFVGDGFRAGLGCRKESSTCDFEKYMSGQCGGTTRVGVLAGGIVAGACLMIGLGLLCFFIHRRSESKYLRRSRRRFTEATGINIPIYSFKEIERSTNFFSDKQCLGTGAYGTVYAGKLRNSDEWVAIKRIKYRGTDSIEQVVNEIKLLSSVSHPNLVRLLGCSIEKGEQILVYEFMSNGTLFQHLNREKNSSKGLSWGIRLSIATETAQAIAYLHNSINPPIFHRDIKSMNILLDYNYKCKVADFGLSRLGMAETSHISTAPQGTPGYLDPQYHQNFHLSDKSDVYSFGVVLVELITALKVVDFSRPQHEVNLASLAVDRIGKGLLDEIIDPKLGVHKDEWVVLSVHKVAELAFRCLAYERDMRPCMMEVAAELEQICLSKWGSSESSSYSSSSASNGSSEKPVSVGVQEPWLSEQSSPSSNSLLNHVVR